MNQLRQHFRIIVAALALGCYLLGASVVPLVEGLHFVAHYIGDEHADQKIHSYFQHVGNHSHENLDLFENIMSQESDVPNTEVEMEVDKKNQICQNEWFSDSTQNSYRTNHIDPFSVYYSQITHIPTPPPEV